MEPVEENGGPPAGGRRGRRPAGDDTRARLLTSAAEVFAEFGFAGASVRTIATRAGVDAAMVNHWFGGKQGLFNAVVDMPFNPAEVIERLLRGDRDALAERIVATFITAWDAYPDQLRAVIHSVSSQDAAARMLRDFLVGAVIGKIAEAIEADHRELRTALCASQIVGLGMIRYVVRLEPLASADVDTVVAAVAPTIQRYLFGDLRTN